MVIGFVNETNTTLQDLVSIGNVTKIEELAINVNNDIYGGWLFFILLCILWYVLYRAMDERVPSAMVRTMYGAAIVTVLSFFLRVIEVVQSGVPRGLITDSQLWVFPLVTLVIAWILWAIRD